MKRLLLLLAFGWLTLGAASGQAISPYLAGQNAWLPKGYGGVTYNGILDQLWPTVQKSKVQLVRIGGNGVEFHLPSGPEYVALIDSVRRIGAEPMVQVPEGRGRYTAAQAAAVVQYVNVTMGRNVKYWIIGNEPNLTSAAYGAPTPAARVAAYTKDWASAMKAVDPTILTVGPELSFYDTSYLNALIGGANDITGRDANGRTYVDVVTFHSYPFSGSQTRAQVLAAAQTLSGNVDRLLTLLKSADNLNGRTGGPNALKWAVTEFNIGYANPTVNTVEGLGVHSFLNGQYWAEVFGIGMQKGAVTMAPWSVQEGNGARGTGDLGYLDGATLATIKPRSAYYHELLVAENLRGTYLVPTVTGSPAGVSVLASTSNGTTAVMLLNKSDATDYPFTVQLDGNAVPGPAALKVSVPASISASYTDKISNQSTLVLLFNSQGVLTRKITYSLQHAQNNLPPSYRNTGQSVAVAGFSADKTFACTIGEQVSFTASVLGDYTSLTWNFGAGASPATASGKGPVATTYTTAGTKTVRLTLVNPDTTIVVTKADYVQTSTCARTSYSGTPAVLPGVIKAVEYDNGGQNVAYYDTDLPNRGALADPTVPRPNESVDTENGGEGLGNIGYSANGEWQRYTVNVLRTGLYQLVARVAATASAGTFRVSVNGVDKTGVVSVPASGSFGTYQDVVINNVFLDAAASTTLQFDFVTSAFNFEKLTFTEQAATGIVVNRLYNATATADGSQDAVELLVVKDHLDIRGLIIKDFENSLTTDTGGKYQLTSHALWQDLRIGTTIVLRRLAANSTGYVPDLNAVDFTLDLPLENTTYLTDLSASGQNFNLTQTDMVVLKTGGAAGTASVVHAFATGGGGSTALYNALAGNKLTAAATNGTGFLAYPTNPTQTTADYNGTAATTVGGTTEATRNWGYGYGQANVGYIAALRGQAFVPPPVVVNRLYNATNDADGNQDAVELLVVQDHYDLRGLIVKDFEASNTTDAGGKYQFTNTAFWADVRSGTTIVLRQQAGPTGYVQDTNASDFTLDMLLGNPTYLTKVGTGLFNITQYDMVLLKTGLNTGTAGAIHAFATRGGNAGGTTQSAQYLAVTSAKMTSPDGSDAGGLSGSTPGTSHYPLNPDQAVTDYNGAKGALIKTANLNWGYGYGQPNSDYIASLRNAVLRPSLTVANGQNMMASGNYTSITVQGGGTLTLAGPTNASGAVLVRPGGVLITNCQPLTGLGSFELQAGAELQVCDPAGLSATDATGAVQLAGARTFAADATYTYNGTAAQLTGAGLPATVRTLTLSNAAGLTLSQALRIGQVASLQSGNLTTAGQAFTLLSTVDGTALLDNTGGVVVGEGTMQRALTGGVSGPAYRQFSSPVGAAKFSALSTPGFAPTFNAAYNSSAAPGTVSPYPTVFGYDESRLATVASNYGVFDKGWFSPGSDAETLLPGRGYTVNMPATAAPVACTGTFNNAAQNAGPLSRGPAADAGWQLLGNPYPSPLDWSTVADSQLPGMEGAMYVFQSTGQYAGTYRSYTNGVGASPLIAAGSGYFVRVKAAGVAGEVHLTNANRVTAFSGQPTFGRLAADGRPQVQLRLTGAGLSDNTFVYLEAGATAAPDAHYDAAKLFNSTGLDLVSLAGSTPLAINGLPPLAGAEVVVPLAVSVPQAGSFELTVPSLTNLGHTTVLLRDAFTGTQLALTSATRYPFSLATPAAGGGRFSLVLRPATALATTSALDAAAILLYPNPAQQRFTVQVPPLAGRREVTATLYNALGQPVLHRTLPLTAAGATAAFDASGLPAGVYVLRVGEAVKRVVLE
ncbi:MAG: carbohydrate-binding protein [Cytophagaceae bacterium]|nr:MAG: carbohydrate-binding protein [Cytophagaceae bacterium]